MRNAGVLRIGKSVVSALLVIPALLLILFGPRAAPPREDGRVIVDYWEKWTGNEESQLRQIVADFNNTVGKDRGIFVRCLSTSGITQKTLVSTAAGVPPDIAGMWDPTLPQFAALDALEPLDDLAAEFGITPASYKPVFWKECHYDGKLYALVSTPYDIALHYNKRIFQERAASLRAAGLDPNRPPATLQELDAYAAAIDQVDPSGRIALAGYIPLEPGWYINSTCVWFGGSWWDETHRRFTFSDPRVVRAYDWIQSYSKRLGSAAVTDFRAGLGNFDSPQNAFMDGSVAMEQQGTFMANFIHHQKPSMDHDWAAAPFPSADPALTNVTYCTADVLTIPKGAKHKREAFTFIAFVNRQNEMEKLCSLHCKISPLAKVSEEFLAHHGNPYIRVFEQLAAGPNAVGTPSVPILPEVTDEMKNLTDRVTQGGRDPTTELARVQTVLQTKYDAFMRRQQAHRSAAAN